MIAVKNGMFKQVEALLWGILICHAPTSFLGQPSSQCLKHKKLCSLDAPETSANSKKRFLGCHDQLNVFPVFLPCSGFGVNLVNR